MARTESRTKVAIWSDPAFLALTERAQRVYWMLYSQPTINLCGIVALTVRRWASKASDSTEAGIVEALAELETAGFIVTDMHTEEVWVRSFVRHDGVAKSPKTRQAALEQLPSIFSERLRALAADALSGTDPEPPDNDRNTLSAEAEYPIPESEIPQTENRDRPRTRARAVSVSSLQSPSPSSSLRLRADAPDGDCVLRTGTGDSNPTPTGLAARLLNACQPSSIEAGQVEAAAVVDWALRHVDQRLLEEAIGWAEAKRAGPAPIKLPRAVAAVIAHKAADQGIPVPDFDPRAALRLVKGVS